MLKSKKVLFLVWINNNNFLIVCKPGGAFLILVVIQIFQFYNIDQRWNFIWGILMGLFFIEKVMVISILVYPLTEEMPKEQS